MYSIDSNPVNAATIITKSNIVQQTSNDVVAANVSEISDKQSSDIAVVTTQPIPLAGDE